ncbi:predicted MFS family arabinose efflux permease [Ureibacillus xyleni]|uniref:Predicted MFS family arabinose efflux permease n=1 Tax=Ureibacillus xyleni TaxID=614648 RepID=A0A285TA97_9BACL|nr:MFS transporter [Ureibacillus xyleni]SOC18485.1 predicted MFS family arabinose efflux permease [Ureibacillus xyleni]
MKYFIYTVIFFSFFDLFTQLPVMSTFAKSVGASSFITGLAVGMYSFSNTFGNVISGFWTDRKGPSILLPLGLVSTGLSLLSYGVVNDALSLLIIRFVHGLVAGLIVPAAFTYHSTIMVKEERGKSSALSGAFVGIAAITGPAFSGILASRTSVPFVFSISGICMLLIGVIAIFVLRRISIKRKITNSYKEKDSIKVRYLFRNPGVIKAFWGAFFLMFAQGVIAYLLPLQTVVLGYDSKVSGTLLSTFGVVAVLVFILPTNRIFDKVAPIYTLSLGIALMGSSLLLLSVSTVIVVLYLAMASYGIGFGLLFPSINALLIDSTDEKVRGKAYGYFYAFFSLGVVVGSSVLGLLQLSISQGFLFTGVILLLFSLVVLINKRSQQFST